MQLARNLGVQGWTRGPLPVSLIAITTRDGQPHFEDFWKGRALVNELDHLHRLGFAYTLAYLVLPDRLGWMVRLGRPWSLREVIQRFKERTARRLDQPVWNPGYRQTPVRSRGELESLAWRLAETAVSCGLAERIEDYPLWDHAWIGQENVPGLGFPQVRTVM